MHLSNKSIVHTAPTRSKFHTVNMLRSPKSLLDLPEAILGMICYHLDDVRSLGRAAQAHSLLRLAAADADAWERLAHRHAWLLRRRECASPSPSPIPAATPTLTEPEPRHHHRCAAPIDLCRRVHTGASAERLVFIGGDPGLTLNQDLPLQSFDPTAESWEVLPVGEAGGPSVILSEWVHRDFSAPCAATDLRSAAAHLFVLGGWDDDANEVMGSP